MRIGLIDADLLDKGTRHPNLALMKIAGYYLKQENEVKLIDDYMLVYEYDRVFISKVFSFSRVPEWVLLLEHVFYGGTGFFEDGGENLPDEIEHHMPYYDLYKEYVELQIANGRNRSHFSDYLDYSIGFASRGCFRKCEFCVNKKYNRAFRHSHIKEFYDSSRPYIYLWDDNILALPQWEDVLDELEETGRPFQFRQGIDLRLMTDKKAKKLVLAHYRGDFIFAFDHIEDKEIIIEKVQLWRRYSSKICKMYVISAYKAQDETDISDVFERIHILMKYGTLPYIMRYEAYKSSPYKNLYTELARWCNQPNFFKKKSFREFCVANQEYKKNKSTNCSAYQSMIDFEQKFPEIAKRYFDLKFDEENIYKSQYGYGRKYANKPLCSDCIKKGICWDCFVKGTVLVDDVLRAYFTKELDLECLCYTNSECNKSTRNIAEMLSFAIINTPIKKIIALIRSSDNREYVTKENIPQYSNLNDALYNVVTILHDSGQILSFEEIGHYLTRDDPNAKQNLIANKKYGENHTKLAVLLDLVLINKQNAGARICLSEFGKYYCQLPRVKQEALAYKLCLRIPIIQNFFIEGCSEDIIDRDLKILSKETEKRRRSNVKNVVKLVMECGGIDNQ